jgi:hypothetical protein
MSTTLKNSTALLRAAAVASDAVDVRGPKRVRDIDPVVSRCRSMNAGEVT